MIALSALVSRVSNPPTAVAFAAVAFSVAVISVCRVVMSLVCVVIVPSAAVTRVVNPPIAVVFAVIDVFAVDKFVVSVVISEA